MTLALWFLLGPCVYLWMAWTRDRRWETLSQAARTGLDRRSRILSVACVLVAAAASSIGAFDLVTHTDAWREGAELAWTGIEADRPEDALTIGGLRERTITAWPGGTFWPRVTVGPAAQGTVPVAVSGGSGFVQVGGRYLNGVAVAEGEKKAFQGFTVQVLRSWVVFRRIVIWSGNEVLADQFLRSAQDRVFAPSRLISEAIGRLRADKTPGKGILALQAERWAAETRMVVERSGALRVLSPEQGGDFAETVATVQLPAALTVRWAGRSLDAALTSSVDGRTWLRFAPPWRHATPVAPRPDGQDTVRMVITGQPRPDDRAFELPLGAGAADLRRDVELKVQGDSVEVLGPAGRRRIEDAEWRLPGWEEQIANVPGALAATLDVLATPVQGVTGALRFDIDVVRALPSSSRLLGIAALGLATLVAGMLWIWPVTWLRTFWVLNGLALASWNVLVFRFLLACRYALDPRYIDKLAVKELLGAALALVLLPPLFFIAIRLWRDRFSTADWASRRRWLMATLAALAAIPLLLWVQAEQVRTLWLTLPPGLWPGRDWKLAGLLACCLAGLAVEAVLCYRIRPTAGDWRLRLSPLQLVPRILDSATRRDDDGLPLGRLGRFWLLCSHTSGIRFWTVFLAAAIPLGITLLALATANALTNAKLFQEIAAPFLFTGLSLLLWISYKAVYRSGSAGPPARILTLLAVGITFAGVPIFVVPLVMRDVGGVFATAAVFVPLAALLIALPPRRPGWTLLGIVAVGVTFVVVLLSVSVNAGPGRLVGAMERGLSRYVVFTRGLDAELSLSFAVLPGKDPEQVTATSLQNAIEHTWENGAMAHEGKLNGLGFGNAPARRSMVPQDDIQSDSTFSFFVLGEYGLVGGVSLLLLYAIPVALVLLSGKQRFDAGHALAGIITLALLNEALVHAAANLGSIMFTGRNLPGLSVNSNTDLMRWILLVCLAGQAVLWRAGGDDGAFVPERGESIISLAPGTPGVESPWNLKVVGLAMAFPSAAALVALVLAPGWRVVHNADFDVPFGWDRHLGFVNRLISDGQIRWDEATHNVVIGSTRWRLNGRSLLEQEVARFNALSDSEKFGDAQSLAPSIATITNVQEYDAVLELYRQAWADRVAAVRAPLFRLAIDHRHDDQQAPDSSPHHVLEVNTDYNIRLSFKTHHGLRDLPRVVLDQTGAGGRDGTAHVLVGPAWINGDVRNVVSRDFPLPWVGNLADVVSRGWNTGRSPDGRVGDLTLTLDPELHARAMRFAALKGRDLHDRILRTRSGHEHSEDYMIRSGLPPRVGLSIVELPGGEVRALGGWPVMTSQSRWVHGPDQREWQPPALWIERSAPSEVRRRYEGDRNFDPIEMGSTTKPLWAAAVLGVHPFLAQRLQTLGGSETEDEAFGIRIGAPWEASKGGGWRTFRQYLAASDNRYQVRLGFLGLAEGDGHAILDDGVSPSSVESVAGSNPGAWHRYPKFPSQLAFSKDRPERLVGVESTPLARNLWEMFSIGRTDRELRAFRASFWTGREADDTAAADPGEGERRGRNLPPAPAAVSFALDRLERPRDFVSLQLGGFTNRWANVDYAAAFATVVTGHPVIAHVVAGTATEPRPDRRAFPEIAERVRPGLSGVVGPGGTAFGPLAAVKALGVFASMPDVKVYAKTGTALGQDRPRETSRLVIAMVRWKSEKAGEARSGLVFSLVIERGQMGMASRWLGEFLVENRAYIHQILYKSVPSTPGAKRAGAKRSAAKGR